MKEVDIAVQRDYTKSEEATATMILQMLTTATAASHICINSSNAVLHAACRREAMKMTMTHMKISMDSILVCYVCPRPIYHWVITAGTFLSVQGVTVQTVILPRNCKGLGSIYSCSPVAVLHWTSVKETPAINKAMHEKFLDTTTLKECWIHSLRDVLGIIRL